MIWPWLALTLIWLLVMAIAGSKLDIDWLFFVACFCLMVWVIIAAIYGSYMFLVYFQAWGFQPR